MVGEAQWETKGGGAHGTGSVSLRLLKVLSKGEIAVKGLSKERFFFSP